MTKNWYNFDGDKPDKSINPRDYNSSLRVKIIDDLTFDIYMIWV